MIEIDITNDMLENAYDRANDIGHLNNSITSGQGNLAGIIGEDIVKDYIGGKIDNTYDYDVVKEDILYDVKTKRCTSKPRDYYECSVAAFNTKQKCHKYIFVRVLYTNDEYSKAWILGEYDKEQYFKDAKFLKKGQIDGDNGFRVKADCYNIPISKLKKPLDNSKK
jgi:hypothetical protein